MKELLEEIVALESLFAIAVKQEVKSNPGSELQLKWNARAKSIQESLDAAWAAFDE